MTQKRPATPDPAAVDVGRVASSNLLRWAMLLRGAKQAGVELSPDAVARSINETPS